MYAFTSTKVAATPGTVYWEASFSTANIPACEGLPPGTQATRPRALTVLLAPAPQSPTPPPPSPTPAPSTISLAGSSLTTQSNGAAAVKLSCVGGHKAAAVQPQFQPVKRRRTHPIIDPSNDRD